MTNLAWQRTKLHHLLRRRRTRQGAICTFRFMQECLVWCFDYVEFEFSAGALTSVGWNGSLTKGKSENSLKYRVSIHHTTVQKPHSDPRYLCMPMGNIPATTYVLSMLLKHPVQYISQQGLLVSLVGLQSIRDQQGVHSPLVAEPGVSHSQRLIVNSSLQYRAFPFGSSGVPYPVECCDLQSGWHVSNSSQMNTVHRGHASPSQYYPLDHQAHMNTARSSDNTSHRVNGIQALQWLPVWIQFSQWSQFASRHYFLSCTDETNQKSQNSRYCVRVGHHFMASLDMLRYHTKREGYFISSLHSQYWCSDPHGSHSHIRVWNQFTVSSPWW